MHKLIPDYNPGHATVKAHSECRGMDLDEGINYLRRVHGIPKQLGRCVMWAQLCVDKRGGANGEPYDAYSSIAADCSICASCGKSNCSHMAQALVEGGTTKTQRLEVTNLIRGG